MEQGTGVEGCLGPRQEGRGELELVHGGLR